MIHYGIFAAGGHVKTVYRHTEENKRLDRWMEKMYLEKIRKKIPNFSIQRLKGILDHDYFLDAQKSIEYGLCDKIEE
jgi:ATP-dependent protease ClpP protease subunit